MTIFLKTPRNSQMATLRRLTLVTESQDGKLMQILENMAHRNPRVAKIL